MFMLNTWGWSGATGPRGDLLDLGHCIRDAGETGRGETGRGGRGGGYLGGGEVYRGSARLTNKYAKLLSFSFFFFKKGKKREIYMSNIIFLCVSDILEMCLWDELNNGPAFLLKPNKKIESTTVEINFSSPAESGRNRDPLLSVFV